MRFIWDINLNRAWEFNSIEEAAAYAELAKAFIQPGYAVLVAFERTEVSQKPVTLVILRDLNTNTRLGYLSQA